MGKENEGIGTSLIGLPDASSAQRFIKCPPSRRSKTYENCVFVACYATLHPALSVGRSVSRLPKWFGDLKYGPYPPACDWGSLVAVAITRFINLPPHVLDCL